MSDAGNFGTGAQALAGLNELVIALNAIAGVMNNLASIVPPPGSSTAAGTAGSLAIDANFLYVCTATNSWKRIALVTF